MKRAFSIRSHIKHKCFVLGAFPGAAAFLQFGPSHIMIVAPGSFWLPVASSVSIDFSLFMGSSTLARGAEVARFFNFSKHRLHV